MFETIIEMQTKLRHQANESKQMCIRMAKAPIHPTCLIVLAIGVIVSALRPADFVSHQQHRRSNRKQGQGYHVLDLLQSHELDFGIARRTFDSAIPAKT
jgi:hypothetical protein